LSQINEVALPGGSNIYESPMGVIGGISIPPQLSR